MSCEWVALEFHKETNPPRHECPKTGYHTIKLFRVAGSSSPTS